MCWWSDTLDILVPSWPVDKPLVNPTSQKKCYNLELRKHLQRQEEDDGYLQEPDSDQWKNRYINECCLSAFAQPQLAPAILSKIPVVGHQFFQDFTALHLRFVWQRNRTEKWFCSFLQVQVCFDFRAFSKNWSKSFDYVLFIFSRSKIELNSHICIINKFAGTLLVIFIPLSDVIPAGFWFRSLTELQAIFAKEMGICFCSFVQPIEIKKIQARLIRYEAFWSNVIITITNLTVKFTFHFQGVNKIVSTQMVCFSTRQLTVLQIMPFQLAIPKYSQNSIGEEKGDKLKNFIFW